MNVVYVTSELVSVLSDYGDVHRYLGSHAYGPHAQFVPTDQLERTFACIFPEMLAACPGGRRELRDLVAPCLRKLVDQLPAGTPRSAVNYQTHNQAWGMEIRSSSCLFQVCDVSGAIVGYVAMTKPAAGMTTLGTLGGVDDVRHLERALGLASPGRRPAAILFADLDGSSALARRLSTPDYFRLARRLVRDADRCVVDAGGLVGRHVGDGVSAFFLAEVLGSESAAARGAIEATRAIREAAAIAADRHGLSSDDVSLRFGLHWGATLYVGLIKSTARSEVTALGDEVNEAARLEACASGGRALVSKALLERLDTDDANALGVDPDHLTYTALAALPTATDKARRDAPAIAVCEI